MEHETKNEDHQTREDEVANLWCTWMSEIPTKLEKMGQHLLSNLAWRRRSSSSVCVCVCWLRLGEEEGDL